MYRIQGWEQGTSEPAFLDPIIIYIELASQNYNYNYIGLDNLYSSL